MLDPDGRKLYKNLDPKAGTSVLDQIKKIELEKAIAYDFYMSVDFDRSVLVKADGVDEDLLKERLPDHERKMYQKSDSSRRPPDKMPLMDVHGKYVVPGSSIKGVFRNQMERIAAYKGDYYKKQLIPEIFEGSHRIFFYDAMLDDKTSLQTRIHIDKLTGGIIDRSLFSEAVTGGESMIHIRLNKSTEEDQQARLQTKQAAAFLLLTMRDCAVGAISIGSGYSIGRGFMKVSRIKVLDGENEIINIDVDHISKSVETEIIRDWLISTRQEV